MADTNTYRVEVSISVRENVSTYDTKTVAEVESKETSTMPPEALDSTIRRMTVEALRKVRTSVRTKLAFDLEAEALAFDPEEADIAR